MYHSYFEDLECAQTEGLFYGVDLHDYMYFHNYEIKAALYVDEDYNIKEFMIQICFKGGPENNKKIIDELWEKALNASTYLECAGSESQYCFYFRKKSFIEFTIDELTELLNGGCIGITKG